MVLTIDIKDSAIDKIMYFLEHLKDDVKIIKNDDFMEDMKKSEKDMELGNLTEIDNVDDYISNLRDEVK